MRTFELRVYKLRTEEALDFYMEQFYPRHLSSFPLFGIEAHGFWTAKVESSHLQQAPLLNDGKRKQREQMNTTTGFDSSANA